MTTFPPIPTYVVDDVTSDRYIARRRLMKSGAFGPLKEAASGTEFLETYFTDAGPVPDGPPPLILMDVNMPDLDGFETVEELARRLPEEARDRQVVAIFSSSDNDRDIARSRQTGLVAHFFTKPLDEAAVAQLLETYRRLGHAEPGGRTAAE